MNEETLRVPNEKDADQVARLLSEGSPEPVGSDSVLRDWSFPGVYARFAIYEKGAS
jgi:muconolactone delta-isomerase